MANGQVDVHTTENRPDEKQGIRGSGKVRQNLSLVSFVYLGVKRRLR